MIVVFRATKIIATLRVDVPVAIRAAKNLEGTMLLSTIGVGMVAFWKYQKSVNIGS